MISIPELPTITSSGWNSFGEGISVKSSQGSTFNTNKELVISADSSNNWKLVLSPDKSDSVSYYLATSSTDTEATTKFTFSAASIDEGVSQDFGAIVEDYSNKKVGKYEDTITFTVEVTDTGTETTGNVITLTADTGEVTVNDGDTLTGTGGANTHVTIAAGATITLDSVDITSISTSNQWAGITPLGNATIILEGTNAVKGGHEDYPGIFISPDSTLTISGDGSLTASSNGWAAGIGSGYGNSASCGNITISGGTITAAGGSQAAGIGSGYKASCGTITITTGVTSVKATAGGEDWTKHSIGAGADSSCGTVIIGGTVYSDGITESPYTYSPSN